MTAQRSVTPGDRQLALEVTHLSVRLDGLAILDDINLALPHGACVGLIGQNGSGKSTLLRAVLGLTPLAEGVIRILGQHPERGRHLVGYLPQHKGFDRSFPATALELVTSNLRGRWPARITRSERERSLAALERFGVAHLASRQLSRLSGGELQRVYLARATVIEPRLLLLDEPNTGLDPDSRNEVDGILCELAQDPELAMVVVTHDLRGLQTYANHVVYLDRRILSEGDPETILAEAPDHVFFGHVHHDDHGADECPRPER